MDVIGSLCCIPFVTLLDDGKLLDGKGQGTRNHHHYCHQDELSYCYNIVFLVGHHLSLAAHGKKCCAPTVRFKNVTQHIDEV